MVLMIAALPPHRRLHARERGDNVRRGLRGAVCLRHRGCADSVEARPKSLRRFLVSTGVGFVPSRDFP
jgi:hypothetical protein